ncbi:hypothetical protein BKA93DRAFT_891354 [Sparassis latifolia]|uniref:Macrofage activating glycoprotein n=1 Tax=Sparassis crispa TaxID=139825 RepID=A0A401GK10_9APHY|nr:hypothetical protein SCP_0408910 [Sparassis crispa]GBE82507.1 hypothetical protein SCP_0408910 [Sparassis crispa]
MSPVARSLLLTVALATSSVVAQYASSPLAFKSFTYTDLPEQAQPTAGIRGPQAGYNICNSTTQNQESMCQTAILNSIDDFCIWAPPQPNSTIADTEGIEVAYCTKNGRGTRLIPQGTLWGVSVLNTPQYVMILALLNQANVNMQASDYGGELDPHGADGNGNPIGGLVFSTHSFAGASDNTTLGQLTEWTSFIGGNQVCFKGCNPADVGGWNTGLCNNIYDEIGIAYNCPGTVTNGTFMVCDADPMSPVGIYTSNGVTMTYSQPASGVITSMPYTPTVPATSNCVTYKSTDLYTDLASVTASSQSTTSGGSATSTPTSHSGSSGSSSASRSGSSGAAAATGASGTNGASAMHVSLVATLAGVVAAVAFLS